MVSLFSLNVTRGLGLPAKDIRLVAHEEPLVVVPTDSGPAATSSDQPAEEAPADADQQPTD